jgi:hypothetical protein
MSQSGHKALKNEGQAVAFCALISEWSSFEKGQAKS